MANGDDWVRRFHAGSVSAAAAGIVDVARGRSAPARMLGRLMRLPPPAAGLAARLCIVRQAEGTAGHEQWIRTFGTARLATRMVRAGERAAERFGPVELRMRCLAAASEVWFIPDGAAIVLGRLSFRLPGLVAPRAYAHAWSSGDRAFDVEVSVRIPLLGALISYRGHFLEAEECKPCCGSWARSACLAPSTPSTSTRSAASSRRGCPD
jgi:hypothetical protein